MMRQFYTVLMALAASACVFVMPAVANEKQAEQFAIELAQSAVTILEDGNLSDAGKQNALEGLFSKSIDFDWVARFVLGKHWRTAEDAQRKAYATSYKQFIVANFTQRLGEYSGQNYVVKHVRADGEPGEYLLTMELKNSNETAVFLDYRLRKQGPTFKIFDIIIEGVSLITTQRTEFNSVVDRKGLDFLISALEKRAGA
jgi:phospholipid transport system substrate-binding protein